MEKKLFFVYGTLLEGFSNYNRILKGKTVSIREAKIEGFDMYSVGFFPAIVPGEGTVFGEVIEVDPAVYEETKMRLDILEGYYPTKPKSSMYLRKEMKVLVGDEEVDAYVYIWNDGLPDIKVHSGSWRDYWENRPIEYKL